MNVLLIGSGGREHALAWSISASPLLTKLYCAPGNAGIAEVAQCVALDAADHAAVIAFCKASAIDFVIVGPEIPLVAGIVDALSAAGIKSFGPTKAAAQLEGSKGFTKDLCREFSIPTAAYGRFTSAAGAKAYLAAQSIPIVIVSYKDRDEDRIRGMEAGANGYLTKSSFHDGRFVQTVEELIGAPGQ